MSQVAADGRAHGIRPRKALGIDGVVALEETRVAKVDVDFHHIAQGSAISGENGGNVVDGLIGLLLNVVADQLATHWVDRT